MEVRRSHQHSCQGVCLLHRRPNGRRRPGWPLDHRVLDRSIKVSRGCARTWRPAHSPYTYAQACPGATCIYSPLRTSCAHAGAEARRRDRMRGRVGGVTGGGATGGGTMGGEPTGLAARLAAAYCRQAAAGLEAARLVAATGDRRPAYTRRPACHKLLAAVHTRRRSSQLLSILPSLSYPVT